MKKSKKEEIIDMRARDRLKEQSKKINPALANQVFFCLIKEFDRFIDELLMVFCENPN